MKLTRSYQLKIYPRFHKLEDLRYSAYRYRQFLQAFVNLFFYKPWSKGGTFGMGKLANLAQHEARGIAKSARSNPNADCPVALKGQERLQSLADKTPVTTWR